MHCGGVVLNLVVHIVTIIMEPSAAMVSWFSAWHCVRKLHERHFKWRARGGAVGSGTTLQAGRLRVRLELFIDIIFPAAQ
jgi:hypothetical protein